MPSSGPESSSHSAASKPAAQWATKSRTRARQSPGQSWSAESSSPPATSAELPLSSSHSPASAVSGLQGFVNGVHALSDRLGLGWVLIPIALLVGVNTVGSTAANLSSTSRLPFVAGIDHYLPPVFGSIHPRYRTPWVAIAVYGAASILVAILGQAGTTVRGAYNVLVSMAVICQLHPLPAALRCHDQAAERTSWPQRPPRAREKTGSNRAGPHRFIATATTIVLSLFPGADQPNKTLAVFKVVGATLAQLGLGIAIFTAERRIAPQHRIGFERDDFSRAAGAQ